MTKIKFFKRKVEKLNINIAKGYQEKIEDSYKKLRFSRKIKQSYDKNLDC